MVATIVSVGITLFAGICIILFFDIFAQRKITGYRILFTILFALPISATTFVSSFFFMNNSSFSAILTKMLIATMIYSLFGKLFYVCSWLKLIPYSLCAFLLIYLTDYIWLALTDLLMGQPDYFFTAPQPTRVALSIIYKSLLFVLIMVIRLICQHLSIGTVGYRPSRTRNRWTLYLLLPIICVSSITSLFSLAEPEEYASPLFMMIAIAWLFMNLVVFFILQYTDKKDEELRENQIIEQYTATELRSLNTVKLVNETYHDMQNDIICIRDYLEKGKLEQAREYVNQLPYTESLAVPRVNTENDVVDAIVNQKYWVAQRKSIYMLLTLSNLSELPIEDRDLVAILSNLLDNAIEACERVEGERIIRLKIVREGNELIIAVKNPVAEPMKIIDKHIVTHKKDKHLHGYGMLSIQRSLEKYDACYAYKYEDMSFIYSAVIPLKKQDLV